MARWKFMGKERKFLCGQWLFPGNIIEADERPNTWFKLESESGDNTKIVAIPTKNVVDNDDIRKELSKMKRQELRKIGDKYGVKDTSKSELIEEIIEAKKQEGDL